MTGGIDEGLAALNQKKVAVNIVPAIPNAANGVSEPKISKIETPH